MARANVVRTITSLIERQLQFCLGLPGGHDDADGHWVYKSSRELCDWLKSFHDITVSEDTVARALESLVEAGRWVRAQLGKRFGHRSYYYRPAIAESTPQIGGTESAMERPQTESTSEKTTTDPDRCAVSEPEQPRTRAPRPKPRGFAPERHPAVPVQVLDDGMFSTPASPVTAASLYMPPQAPAGLRDDNGWLTVS